MRGFWLLPLVCLAQRPYFQQEVRYQLQVRLDPTAHRLSGYARIVYTNRSPDTLRGLYFHLWPNAYSRRGTAFDRQKRITGSSRFYFARAEERGYMDSLDFRIEGVSVRPQPATAGPKPAPGYSLALLRHAPDVVWLPLPEPLLPGRSVTLETPFRVRIPRTFSRMGRSESSYQITQWYPKPAVYDAQGWHPLPYLDQGEFYSEWGQYEVEISVPENFLVAATGVLETESEKAWLRQRAEETAAWIASAQAVLSRSPSKELLSFGPNRMPTQEDSLPPLPNWAQEGKPSSTYKTLRFVQDSVHDFAWFSGPAYGLLADTISLPNAHRVACVGVFRLKYARAWQYSPRYIAEAIQKLSKWVGPYPYAHATAVEGGLEAGGGMEYPMITVIIPTTDTATLREIVVHEVGHNWFQGMLASNERLHSWQDEGINSYYERRILTQALDAPDTLRKTTISAISIGGVQVSIGRKRQPLAPRTGNLLLAAYHHLNTDQPFTLSSEKYSLLNYGLGIYQRTALLLDYFSEQVGQKAWDAAMQHYWRKWAFRHPYPADWAQSLTEKGLPGFALLQALESDAEPDFALRTRKVAPATFQMRLLQRKKGYPNALPLSAVALSREGQTLAEYTLTADTSFTLTLPEGTHLFVVNPEQIPFERRVGNNFLYARGPFRTWQRPQLWAHPLTPPVLGYTYLSLTPLIGYNYRDGLMVGALFTHGLFPKRLLEFHALPMYSFLAKDLRGSAGLTLRAFPAGSRLQLIEGRLRSAQFAGFWRTKASIDLTFRRPYDRFGLRHTVRLRSHLLAYRRVLGQEGLRWENAGRPAYTALDWEARREEAILQLYFFTSVGHDLAGHPRAEAESQLYWHALRKWTPFARIYAGWVANGAPTYLLLRPSGFDPFGEQVLLDRFREGSNRLLRQQMPETQGAWRTPSDTLATTTLLAANIELPFPELSILTLRGDMGYLPQERRSYWGLSVGLPVVRLRGRFIAGGYFPVAGTTFSQNRPSSLADIVRSFTWSVQVPLDLRWAVPW